MQRAEELKQFIIDHPDGATPRVAKGGGAGKAADVPQHDAVEGIDLETALSKIIGLEQVKLELQDLEAEIRFNTMRADRGIEGVEKAHAPHMQFLGNPGTGKTMVGKLLGKLLKGIGIVEKGHLVEVKREDLVAMHIGETAQLTKAKIEEAKGGVLFIDEAYQLMPKDSTRDFGKEAVETIMNALHDNDPVFIFAGYPADMERFINANAGLTRRVGRKFNFPDYTPHDIAQIFCKFKLGSFQLEGPKKQWIRQTAALITEKTSDAQLAMYNGGEMCCALFYFIRSYD
jgi:SpoVK/Ycf46/Vps4 family AAA+-type ATPase